AAIAAVERNMGNPPGWTGTGRSGPATERDQPAIGGRNRFEERASAAGGDGSAKAEAARTLAISSAAGGSSTGAWAQQCAAWNIACSRVAPSPRSPGCADDDATGSSTWDDEA